MKKDKTTENECFAEKLFAWNNFLGNGEMRHGITIQPYRMYYPFLIKNVFSEHTTPQDREETDLIRSLRVFMEKFTERVLVYREKTGKKPDWHKLTKELLEAGALDTKYLGKVLTQDNLSEPIELFLPICNAILQIKRFGTSLGIRIKSGNDRGDEHQEGASILKAMSGEGEALMGDFFHKLSLTVKLPYEHAECNSAVIDFSDFLESIKKHCLSVDWLWQGDVLEHLLSAYVQNAETSALVGKFFGNIDIGLRLVHLEKRHQEQSAQWKRGNVLEKNPDGKAIFAQGTDLCIIIDILSGLSQNQFLREKLDTTVDVMMTQGRMKYAAITLFADITSMNMRREVEKIVGFF